MKILLVGGSGFIGTRLVDALLALGHAVRIFDKAASRHHPTLVTLGDVRDAAAMGHALQGIDLTIHLAAEHRDDVQPVALYDDVNVGGTRHLLQAAQAAGMSRLVYVSSAAVYGWSQPMAEESSPLQPADAYGRSKVAAEALCRDWAAADPSRSLLVVRPCVIYGEGNRGNVHHLIDHLRRGRFVMVGSGGNRKSMAYVGNLVDFLCADLTPAPGLQVVNYADKPDPSTRELVDLIRRLLGVAQRDRIRLPFALALAAGRICDAWSRLSGRRLTISSARVRKFCADTRIATPALERAGFRPRHGLEAALALTIAAAASEDDFGSPEQPASAS